VIGGDIWHLAINVVNGVNVVMKIEQATVAWRRSLNGRGRKKERQAIGDRGN